MQNTKTERGNKEIKTAFILLPSRDFCHAVKICKFFWGNVCKYIKIKVKM